MTMMAPMILIAVYLFLIVFGVWLADTFVMAVVRIGDAMERASWTLAEIAKNQAGRTNQPS
jgi:hypothetical protein